MSRNTVARIDTAALKHNLSIVRRMASGAAVVSVVKADAYGHGVGIVAEALAASEVLAVATVGELEAVRNSGWEGRLLLLEGFSNEDESRHLRRSGPD